MSKTREKDKLLSLSELARRADVSKQQVEYYVMVGMIPEATRTDGGHRRFNEQAVARVKLIAKLNKSGYPLREIRDMFLKRELKS